MTYSETDLCEEAMPIIEAEGCVVRCEVLLGRCRADLCAERDGEFHAFAAKLSPTLRLLAQAIDHAQHVHRVTIIIKRTNSPEFKALRAAAKALGFGWIEVVPGTSVEVTFYARAYARTGAQLDQASGGMAESRGSDNRAGMRSPKPTSGRSEVVKVCRELLESEGGRMPAKRLYKDAGRRLGWNNVKVFNAIERDESCGIVLEGRVGDQDAVLVV